MKIQAAGVVCCLMVAASSGMAQSGGVDAVLDRAVADCRIANVKGYLEKVRASIASLKPGVELPPGEADRQQRERACALRLAGDARGLKPNSPWARAPFVCYTVPAVSAVKRLPDTLPPDGIAGDSITVVAAQGEYEPASFVVFPLTDVGSLEVKAGELAGTKGRIPAECVDIKVVKCWYQAGTAWGSYFADRTRRELTPELLLNDDDLVRVDLDRRENYLRVDYAEGPRYVWVSYPLEAGSSKLNYALDPVQDSPALLPVKLRQGMARQFWITVKVPAKAAGGLYQGRITLTADGKPAGDLRLTLRVLPFALPLPMTYYDAGREFYTFMYHRCGLENHLKLTGGDLQIAEKQLAAEMRNMREHNLNYFMVPEYGRTSREAFIRTLQLMKEAGLRTRPLFDAVGIGVHTASQVEVKKRTVTEALALIEKVLGHRDVYAFGADEPGKKALLAEQPLWDLIHRLGGRTYSTGTVRHFPLVGYSEDFCNLGGAPKREYAAQWHAVGGRITSYASPHTGPENPDLARRNHGMLLYKAWYDGSGNYIYYEAVGPDIWNDFGEGYRNFNMVYPTRGGVIDTIAWEGFREGIDDVRYATRLRMLAAQAIDTGDVDAVHAGKKALMWLELLDEKTADLNTMRGEMINYILKLTGILEGGQS